MRSVQAAPQSTAAYNSPPMQPQNRGAVAPSTFEMAGSSQGRWQSADPIAPPPQGPLLQQPLENNRPIADRPVLEAARIPMRPIATPPEALRPAPVAPPTEPPKQDRPADDRQHAGGPMNNALNWLPPQKPNPPVDRWPVPATQSALSVADVPHRPFANQPVVTAAETKQFDNHRSPNAAPPETNELHESIYVSSAQRMDPVRSADRPPVNNVIASAPPLNPVRQGSTTRPPSVAPSAAPANDLRPSGYPSYPAAMKPDVKPWPVSSDPPTATGVRTTSYIDGNSVQQRSASPSSTLQITTVSPQPLTRPLPPTSATQSLPPVITTQPLPPIDGSTDRYPAER
jgi:hypothetical protein